MKRCETLIILILMTAGIALGGKLTYCPSPADNPLKGVVPYAEQYPHGRFPHSMEFHYFPLRQLMGKADGGEDDYVYDWSSIEQMLERVNRRGCQLIFRVYLEYPGKPTGLPQFLIDDGVAIKRWNHPSEGKENVTPDYSDPRLRKAMVAFIHAMGKHYDGDARIGFITAGILGKWGEWHTWPRNELFADKEVQSEVMDAYEAAFKKTPILLRYPAGAGDRTYAANADRRFGYHDDSFAWATLKTGRNEDSWFYMALLENAGPEAIGKWKRCPIGGEIRPELWPSLFTDQPHPRQQDFDDCVRQTHVTWLMDTGLSSPGYELSDQRRTRAIKAIGKMGYEFYISQSRCQWRDQNLTIVLDVENRGVAPFYYHWPVEIALLDIDDYHVISQWEMTWNIMELMPYEKKVWDSGALTITAEGKTQNAWVAVRILNPCAGCKPLRFANCYRPQVPGNWFVIEKISNEK